MLVLWHTQHTLLLTRVLPLLPHTVLTPSLQGKTAAAFSDMVWQPQQHLLALAGSASPWQCQARHVSVACAGGALWSGHKNAPALFTGASSAYYWNHSLSLSAARSGRLTSLPCSHKAG